MLSHKLRTLLSDYAIHKESLTLTQLLCHHPSPVSLPAFNKQLQLCISCTFVDLIQFGMPDDLHSLFVVLIKGWQQGIVILQVLLGYMDNVCECLSMGDLERFVNLGGMEWVDRLGKEGRSWLHRIVKGCLDRLQGSDPGVKGRMQMLLTRVVGFGHQSGFKCKAVAVRGLEGGLSEVEKEILNQSKKFQQFYQKYSELQYNLTRTDEERDKLIEQYVKLSASDTGAKARLPLIALAQQIKKVKNLLKLIIEYFRKNQLTTNTTPCTCTPDCSSDCSSNCPCTSLLHLKPFNPNINPLPLPHLLQININNPDFRLLLLTQVLLYNFSIRTKLHQANIKNQELQSSADQIDNMVKYHLLKSKLIDRFQNGDMRLFEKYYENEIKWVEIKNNIKECIRNMVKVPIYKVVGVKKITQDRSEYDEKLEQELEMYNKQRRSKLSISTTRATKLLSPLINQPLHKHPVTTSFSLYMPRAVETLFSFDYASHEQKAFDSRSQYNLFEFRAMRSLFRQNIKSINLKPNQLTASLRGYRLLQWVADKAGEFGYVQKRVVSLDQTDSE